MYKYFGNFFKIIKLKKKSKIRKNNKNSYILISKGEIIQ